MTAPASRGEDQFSLRVTIAHRRDDRQSFVTEWDGAGPHIEDYTQAKRKLVFCRLAQDGTGEGIFVLDRLPTPTEAVAIRETLVIAKKREMCERSEAQLAARAAFAARSRPNKG